MHLSVAPRLAVVLAGSMLAACGQPASVDPRTQIPLVQVATVQVGCEFRRRFTGVIAARVQSDLGFRVGGKIIERLVDTGQHVRRGDPLMRLDPNDLSLGVTAQQGAVEAARARSVKADADLARMEGLVQQGAVSAQDYDLAVEAARSAKGRRNPDEALAAWEALIRGRWSLVDRFDGDQRRFVVAVRNDPHFSDPRGLSMRERQVAAYAGLGRSAKEIAYLLGAPAASVENSLRRAQAKLGLQSRVELTDFFAPRSLRAHVAEIAVGNETLLVGSMPLLDETKLVGLSPAERHVLALVIAGSTDHDIAKRRSTSPRTVANQVQALFRKFGVRSRSALVARLRN